VHDISIQNGRNTYVCGQQIEQTWSLLYLLSYSVTVACNTDWTRTSGRWYRSIPFVRHRTAHSDVKETL